MLKRTKKNQTDLKDRLNLIPKNNLFHYKDRVVEGYLRATGMDNEWKNNIETKMFRFYSNSIKHLRFKIAQILYETGIMR